MLGYSKLEIVGVSGIIAAIRAAQEISMEAQGLSFDTGLRLRSVPTQDERTRE
jgi:hypothetical protein